jgi:spermidine synthase
LANAQNKYDAVLNDAFSGDVPVGTLTTKEAAEIIKKSLTQGGVYISNVLGAVSGDKGKFLRSEVKTLSKVFKHVYVLRVFKNVKTSSLTNWMVIATDNDGYRPDDIVDVELSDDDIVLTDDYNPIDSLILPNYHD